MNETHKEDLWIEEAMNMSLVNEEPSEDLLRELRVMASKAVSKKRVWWQPGLALAGAIAVTCGVVVLTMTPSKATAHTFDTLVAAVSQVNTFQFSVDSDEGGNKSHVVIHCAGGRFTIQTDEGAFVDFDKGTMRVFDPKENSVTELKLGNIVDPKMIGEAVQSGIAAGLKEMDLKKRLKEYQEKYGKDHIQITPVTQENGKSVYHVTMVSPDDPSEVRMLVDANTDLPESIDVTEKGEGGKVKEKSVVHLRFGGQIGKELTMPKIPKNAKVNSLDLNTMISGAMAQMGNSMKGFSMDSKDDKK